MKKLVISIITKDGKKYIKKGILGSKVVNEVNLNDATIFSNPDEVERLMTDYDLPSPIVEVLDIKISKSLNTLKDKYACYAELLGATNE